MEPLSELLVLCTGNQSVISGFPVQRLIVMFSIVLTATTYGVGGDIRRHGALVTPL